jgi:hypothetical protein
MKNVIMFRLRDEDSIWLADLEAGTIEQADAAAVEAVGADAADLQGDAPYVKGIDFALAAKMRSGAASHALFPSR